MKNGIRNSSVVLAVILLALLAVGALVGGASGPSQPILVTSAGGQSPDDLIVKVMIDKLWPSRWKEMHWPVRKTWRACRP